MKEDADPGESSLSPTNALTQRMEAMQWIWTLETTKLSNLQESNGTLCFHWMTRMDLIIQDAQSEFYRRQQQLLKTLLRSTLSWRGGVMETNDTAGLTPKHVQGCIQKTWLGRAN